MRVLGLGTSLQATSGIAIQHRLATIRQCGTIQFRHTAMEKDTMPFEMEYDGNRRDLIIRWLEPMGENVNLSYNVFLGFAENRQDAETILQEFIDGIRPATFIGHGDDE